MIWAFGRLIFIFIGTLIVFAMGVLGLRFLGGQGTVTELSHPLLHSTPWVIYDGGDLNAGSAQSMPALQKASDDATSSTFLGLHVRLTQDGEWVLYAPARLEELTTGQGFVNQHSMVEINQLHFKNAPPESRLLTLEQALTVFSQSLFYIEVLQPASPNLEKIFDLIDKHKLVDRVVLTSPFADTLREIRGKTGAWLTGSSTIELNKARFMTSIFLETVVDLPGDVFVASSDLHPRLKAELLRRKKIILHTTRPNIYRQLVDGPALSH